MRVKFTRGRAPGTTGLLMLGLLVIPAVIAPPLAQAQTYSKLHAFNGTMGALPDGALAQDAAGNLYGTTAYGGAFGQGTIFKLDTNKQLTVLYNFTGQADGGQPYSGLVIGPDGTLYGTTPYGGAALCEQGCGVVFSLSPSGQETVLHSFTSAPDGAYPFGGLLVNWSTGIAYGTTSEGGTSTGPWGTVYSLNLNTGLESILYSFTDLSDGAVPSSTLIEDSAGNLYGTNITGGNERCGVAFSISPSGQETTLHSFGGLLDGQRPYAALVMDGAGNLYGTTQSGGTTGAGVAFKLTPSGQETVIHNFSGKRTDGAQPGGLTLSANGVLYGTTAYGGNGGLGVVYQINTDGSSFTLLHSFSGNLKSRPDGSNPVAPVIVGTSGILYGTTSLGGNFNCTVLGTKPLGCGEVFQLIP